MAKSRTSKSMKKPPGDASSLLPVAGKPSGGIQNDKRTSPLMKHTHPAATRADIRATGHRTMGSRQSNKPVERSNQRRQPKTGGTGGKKK